MTAPYVEQTGNPATPYRAVHQRHDNSGWDKQDFADQGAAENAANAMAAAGGHTGSTGGGGTGGRTGGNTGGGNTGGGYPGGAPAPPASGTPSIDPAVEAARLYQQRLMDAWKRGVDMAGLTGNVSRMTRNDALDRIWEERPDLAEFFRGNAGFDISTPDGRRRATYHWITNVADPEQRARWGGDPLKVLQDMGVDTGGGETIGTQQWNRQFGEGQRQFDTRFGEEQRQFNQGQQQRWAQTLSGLSGPRDWLKYQALQAGIPADQRIQGQLGDIFGRGAAFGAMTPDPGNSWESALADWAANGMQLPGEEGKGTRTLPTPGPWEGDPDQGRPGKAIPIGGTGTTGTTGGTGTGTGTGTDAAPNTSGTPYVPYPGDSASDDQILLWLYSVRPDIKQVYDGPAGWGGIPDPLTRMRDWWEHGAVTSGDRGGRDLRTYAQQFAAANVRPPTQSTGGGLARNVGDAGGGLTMGTAFDPRTPEWDPQASWNRARTGTRMPWETAPQQGQPGGTLGTLGQATMPRGYDQPSFGEGEPSPSGGPGQKQENPFSLKNLPFTQPGAFTAKRYARMSPTQRDMQSGLWQAQGVDPNDAWERAKRSWVSSGGVASGTRYR